MTQYSTSRLSDYTADLVNQRAADLLVVKAIGERVVDPDELPAGCGRAGSEHESRGAPDADGRCGSHKRNRGIHRSRAAPLHPRTTRGRHPDPAGPGRRTRLLTQPIAAWVGEAVQKPVGTVTFGSGDLAPYKLVSQVVCSVEFVRRGDLDVGRDSARGAREQSRRRGSMMRRIDPANAGTALVKPPSLTYGVTPVTRRRVRLLSRARRWRRSTGRAPGARAEPGNALQSSGLLGDLRDANVQVLISESAGANVIALDSERIVLAIGDSEIDSARHATMRLDTAPASGALTNLWSANLIAFQRRTICVLVRRRRRRHLRRGDAMSTTLRLTDADLKMLVSDLAATTKVFVAEKITEATAPLEARLAELEAREYLGVWSSDKNYRKGAMVTYDGSLWIARIDSHAVRPGTSQAWQMAVRKGSDGRDRRDAVQQMMQTRRWSSTPAPTGNQCSPCTRRSRKYWSSPRSRRSVPTRSPWRSSPRTA